MTERITHDELFVEDIMKEIRELSSQEVVSSVEHLSKVQKFVDPFSRKKRDLLGIAGRISLEEDIPRKISQVAQTKFVPGYWELEGRFVFVKKIVRRVIAFQIEPIAERQNLNNDAVFETLQSLVELAYRQEKRIKQLEARIELLEGKGQS